MTTKAKTKFLYTFLTFGLLCAGSFLYAQGPGGPGPDPDPGPGGAIPIDGGISLVIAAGVAYAAKKGYDKRKKMNKEETGQ